MSNVAMTTYSSPGRSLHGRGVVNVAWAEGGPVKWLPDKAAWLSHYTTIARDSPVGFCGHESHLEGAAAEWLVSAVPLDEASLSERVDGQLLPG